MPAQDRIVVCDDEAELRDTLIEYLERRGYHLRGAPDGAALDAILAQGDVDVVILNINLPGEDGLSILRRITQTHAAGVIMLTAAGETVDRIVGLELGADDYLAKPVAIRELEARIRSLLRRRPRPPARSRRRAPPPQCRACPIWGSTVSCWTATQRGFATGPGPRSP